jgi:hypothetical protein
VGWLLLRSTPPVLKILPVFLGNLQELGDDRE